MSWTPAKIESFVAKICRHGEQLSHYDVLGASEEQDLQAQFHELAGVLHPDLHRRLPSQHRTAYAMAYSRVADAYYVLKDHKRRATYDKALAEKLKKAQVSQQDVSAMVAALDPKAKNYLKKAKADLKRGDLASAELNVNMAMSINPESPLLRKVLRSIISKK